MVLFPIRAKLLDLVSLLLANIYGYKEHEMCTDQHDKEHTRNHSKQSILLPLTVLKLPAIGSGSTI